MQMYGYPAVSFYLAPPQQGCLHEAQDIGRGACPRRSMGVPTKKLGRFFNPDQHNRAKVPGTLEVPGTS